MIDIVITIFIISLALVLKKSKIIATLLFLFMWILWGWNTWNGDYKMYENYYYDSIWIFKDSLDYEIGYRYLNFVFSENKFEYKTFMIIFSFFVLYLIKKISFEYSRYPAMFAALYFIIFIMEYVYNRTYLSHIIILYAVYSIIKNIRYKAIIYIVLVILASIIHSTAILALMFTPLVCFDNRIISVKKITIICLGLLLVSIFLFDIILTPLIGGSYLEKFNYYKTDGGFTNIFFGHIILVGLVYYYFSYIIKKIELINSDKRIFILIINFNLISLFYLPIYFHIPYFSRFVRLIFTIDLIFLISTLQYLKFLNLVIKTRLISGFVLIYLIVLIMFIKSTLYLTLIPLYKNNLIFGEEYYFPELRDE